MSVALFAFIPDRNVEWAFLLVYQQTPNYDGGTISYILVSEIIFFSVIAISNIFMGLNNVSITMIQARGS